MLLLGGIRVVPPPLEPPAALADEWARAPRPLAVQLADGGALTVRLPGGGAVRAAATPLLAAMAQCSTGGELRADGTLEAPVFGEDRIPPAVALHLGLDRDGPPGACGVCGCRLHNAGAAAVAAAATGLAAVYPSIEPAPEDPRAAPLPGAGPLEALPPEVLVPLLACLGPRDVARVGCASRYLRFQSAGAAPGLRLRLFPHQRQSLAWMVARETSGAATVGRVPLLAYAREGIEVDRFSGVVSSAGGGGDGVVRGGMLCDEPGLGKTITCLALVLRTLGARSSGVVEPDAAARQLRRRSRGEPPKTPSGATLLIAPGTLVAHWRAQVEAHVAPGALRAWYDVPGAALPADLHAYDLVVTTFARLTQEWRAPAADALARPGRFATEREADDPGSPLDAVHWLRIIVDEGHALGALSISNRGRMAQRLAAERRWVLTGTPTPNTQAGAAAAELQHLRGLLVFLRYRPFGGASGDDWARAVARPFLRDGCSDPLVAVLRNVMMRHSKARIAEIPRPDVRRVVLPLSAAEAESYNAIVAVVQDNLAITDLDPHTPGARHPDSLLHPDNRHFAREAVDNLRLTCCGAGTLVVELEEWARLDTLQRVRRHTGGDEARVAAVGEYMRRATVGFQSACDVCDRRLRLFLVTPCGHLACSGCVRTHRSVCGACGVQFDFEDMQRLQPGFRYDWVLQPEADFRGSKAAYLLSCLRSAVAGSVGGGAGDGSGGLPGSPARPGAAPGAPEDEPQLKAIVFSQFQEHILRLGRALGDAGVPVARFHAGLSGAERAAQLQAFRDDPAVPVLLLSGVGAHGLDLSFVTHIFLMDAIWDKSIEEQVIARAHRMGATAPCVVQSVVMEGTLEDGLLVGGSSGSSSSSGAAAESPAKRQRTQQQQQQAKRARATIFGKRRGAAGGANPSRVRSVLQRLRTVTGAAAPAPEPVAAPADDDVPELEALFAQARFGPEPGRATCAEGIAFATVGAPRLRGQRRYFEVRLLTEGAVCVGWSRPGSLDIVGGDDRSWGAVGALRKLRHGARMDAWAGDAWRRGDLIGCGLDVLGRAWFTRNGRLVDGCTFAAPLPAEDVFPAVTVGGGQSVSFRFPSVVPAVGVAPSEPEPDQGSKRVRFAAVIEEEDEDDDVERPTPAWSVDEVCRWLRDNALGQLEPAFRAGHVSGRVLLELSDEDLRELGVTLGATRRALLKLRGGALGPEGKRRRVRG